MDWSQVIPPDCLTERLTARLTPSIHIDRSEPNGDDQCNDGHCWKGALMIFGYVGRCKSCRNTCQNEQGDTLSRWIHLYKVMINKLAFIC